MFWERVTGSMVCENKTGSCFPLEEKRCHSPSVPRSLSLHLSSLLLSLYPVGARDWAGFAMERPSLRAPFTFHQVWTHGCPILSVYKTKLRIPGSGHQCSRYPGRN
jgi:hypothetical protein